MFILILNKIVNLLNHFYILHTQILMIFHCSIFSGITAYSFIPSPRPTNHIEILVGILGLISALLWYWRQSL